MKLHRSWRELAELGSRMSNMVDNPELLRVVHHRNVQSLFYRIIGPVQKISLNLITLEVIPVAPRITYGQHETYFGVSSTST